MFFPFAIENLRLKRFPFVTWAFLLIHGILFWETLSLTPLERQWLVWRYGFTPARITQLSSGKPLEIVLEMPSQESTPRLDSGGRGKLTFPYDPRGILFSCVSYMFLHAGWFHLLGNLWFLWLFGRAVEDRLGHSGFLLFYFAGGILAALAQWLAFPESGTPVVGASGAIAAILGAFMVLMPRAEVKTLVFLLVYFTDIELPAFVLLTFWFLAQIFSGLGDFPWGTIFHRSVAPVAWWVHIGGFVAGLWIMLGIEKIKDS
ncbi:MAG: rhomboid family intramembrane serine protease [Planctomycetia bacterium]|nr:rhomboid family intramembrane serine protease [Planctomycetia bacterium]